jgi:TRAP-type C4-dicarboxylate transport system substrate-binding protein
VSRAVVAAFTAAAALTAGLVAAPLARADEPHTLKLATLAPEGTLWMNLFHEFDRSVQQRTNGAVRVKFYSGGASGDERDMVRKMRLGQLSGAAVTSIGLGLIQPEVRVLEVPLLLQSWEELDYVRGQLDGELRKKFEDKGYVLLNWGDVGPIHLFSNTPVKSRADLNKTKLWEWVDDPISRALFAKLGLRGVPLGAPDVLPALSTGMVDAAFGTPLAVLALQWHTKLHDMTALHFGYALGATVVTKKEMDKLTPEQQRIVLEEARALEKKLLSQVRQENDRAVAMLKKGGLTIIDAPPTMLAELTSLVAPIRADLEGSLYSHDLRARVEKLVGSYRAKSASRTGPMTAW